MKAGKRLLLTLVLSSLLLGGCGQLLGGLRRDLDDSDPVADRPTTGGAWTERGVLAEESEPETRADSYGPVGHSDRSPASSGWRESPGRGSWVTDDQMAAGRRDQRRASSMEEAADEQEMAPQPRRNFKNGSRATRADFVDESTNEGSLWASDGQTNYFFTKNKVRGVGDIVSVVVEADLLRDVAIEVARTLSPKEKDYELELAQERILSGGGSDQVKSSSSGANRAPATAGASGSQPAGLVGGETRQASTGDIDLSKSLGIKAGDTIMAEIIERYPNGNYKIRGTKKVPYRNATRLVSMLAIVRGADISDDDTTPSGKLYEYRLEANR